MKGKGRRFGAGKQGIRRGNRDGSVVILVLWALVLILFLAEDFLAHNRGKAVLATNAWESLKQREAVQSVLDLIESNAWQSVAAHLKEEDETAGNWVRLSPGGIDVWAALEDESARLNINTAPDDQVREKIRQGMGEEMELEADELADAILDWRDTDTLVRTHGAEAGFYKEAGVLYAPANGPFNVLTELLLVKGVYPDLFWGDPMGTLLWEIEKENDIDARQGVSQSKETDETRRSVSQPVYGDTFEPISLARDFTIFAKEVKRVSIIVPGREKGYLYVLVFLKQEKSVWSIVQRCQAILTFTPIDER